MTTYIKAGFGILAAILYGLGAYSMIHGAFHTVSYTPGDGPTYLVTAFGAAITAFVATQLGIAIASGGADETAGGNGLTRRLNNYSSGSNNTVTVVVMVFDLLVLAIFGLLFIWLWVSPDQIAVSKGAVHLTEAPDYVVLQAKAFAALVIAGAAGVGVAAAK